jgi:hypothetical protein
MFFHGFFRRKLRGEFKFLAVDDLRVWQPRDFPQSQAGHLTGGRPKTNLSTKRIFKLFAVFHVCIGFNANYNLGLDP